MRHAQPTLPQGRHQPDRHLVVAHEDGIARHDVELHPDRVAARSGPVTVGGLDRLEPPRGELIAPAAHALGRVRGVRGTRDVEDARVAELGEVAHRGARSPVLVDRDDARAPALRRGGGDDGDGHVESSHHLESGGLGDDHHHRVDPLAQQALDGRPHGGRVSARGAHRVDAVARLARREVEVHRDRRGSIVDVVRGDEADGPGAAGDERAGRRRRAVVQLGDRLLDALLGRRAHVGQPVEHARDGLMRHSREARDVKDVRGAGALLIRHVLLLILVGLRDQGEKRGAGHLPCRDRIDDSAVP
ncbi:hypothetical protein GCM10025873_14690 [Demequina sediminis]|nr:hypothetical protein GCM10025873_14690 [Demequina sediminis]